jgi:hypothetical protein
LEISTYSDPDALLDDLLTSTGPGGGVGWQDLDFPDFCEQYLVIQDKYDQFVPFILNNVQRHFYETVMASGNTKHLILKARRFGFTTVIQAFNFWQSMRQASRFMSMAHDETTTQFLREMARIFYDELPRPLGVQREYNNYGQTTYDNGSRTTIKTAGSKVGGRGGTFGGGIHASEVAFWTDARSIMSGALQAVSPDAWVFLESTPNGAQGMFYEEVQKALAGNSDFALHFYPWFTYDEYRIPLDPGETLAYTDEETALVEKHNLTPAQIKWRRRKMREPEMDVLFTQEYPEDVETCFLTSGNSAFPNVHLVMGPPVQTAPIRGHEYVAGLDWGQDANYSALSIMDATTKQEVYLNRWRHEPYSVIRKNVIEACRFWNVRLIKPERNSMASNVEALQDEFDARGGGVDVEPLVMSNPVKHELVTEFKSGYQEQGLRLLDTRYGKHEMSIFVKKQTPTLLWTYGAEGKDGGDDQAQDDTVIARLLTWRCVINPGRLESAPAPDSFANYRG